MAGSVKADEGTPLVRGVRAIFGFDLLRFKLERVFSNHVYKQLQRYQ